MQVGEVRPAESSDFDRLIELASQNPTNSDWELAVKKSHCSVYTRQNDACSFKMIKVSLNVNYFFKRDDESETACHWPTCVVAFFIWQSMAVWLVVVWFVRWNTVSLPSVYRLS